MARVRAVLKAVARATWRDLRSLNGITANNFFLFSVMLVVMQPPSGAFLGVILALLVFFPMSGDPLRKVPPERLQLLPLDRRERLLVRAGSLVLSPVFWLVAGMLLWGGTRFQAMGWQVVALAVAANLAGPLVAPAVARLPRLNPLRDVPQLPGRMGGLIRKNLREMATVLDAYAALALALAGCVYRWAAAAPSSDALFGITMLVVLALSSYAQQLFALDARQLRNRYRLLPLRGWQILAAKDIAFLLVLLPLVLALAPQAGMAAGCVALAIGHQPSVMAPAIQARWRFVSGASLPHSLVQVGCLFGAGTVTFREQPWVLAGCVVLLVGSTAIFGWKLERMRRQF